MHFEIVSVTGTVSIPGARIHPGISDSTGKRSGGHLLQGCKLYAIAEIVMTAAGKLSVTGEKGSTSTWEELQVKDKNI